MHIYGTVVILDVAKIVINDKNLWHIYLGSHFPTCNIFFENYTVDILAFLLVWMQDCDNFDERVKVDGVGEHSRRWPDSHYRVLGTVGKDLTPFELIDTEVLDHLIDHTIQMATKLMVEPVIGTWISDTIARTLAFLSRKHWWPRAIKLFEEICHGALICCGHACNWVC